MDSDIAAAASRNYRIEVQDFGPITRGRVDFRPLTVFLGPSNAGKSYFATLSYALHRHFAGKDLRWYRLLGPFAPVRNPGPDVELRPELRSELESWASTVTEEGAFPGLPDRLSRFVKEEIEKADGVADPLRDEIVRSFGADRIEDLIRRHGSGRAEVVVALSDATDGGSLRYQMRIGGDGFDIEGKVASTRDRPPSEGPLAGKLRRDALQYQTAPWDETADHAGRGMLRLLVEAVRKPLVAPLWRRSFYLPADRTGIMHSHKMVVGALVQSAATAGLRRTPNVPMLSGVLTDFLEELIQLGGGNGLRHRPRLEGRVPSGLEEGVLGGTVRVESSETNYPQFLYRPKGWNHDLALMRASSMVSELAPLVLYVRHVVWIGDVLIIEEPESHLHPAMQVEIIGWIARIVRAGVRVIVTTHSEWVLDGLANIVRASQVSEGGDHAHDRRPVLEPSDVGVWLFRPGETEADGVMVEEAVIDDSGTYPSGFDEVAVRLHNRWADIESRAGGSD